MHNAKDIEVLIADASHERYVDTILDTIREAAKRRGTGIAERTHLYVTTKMKEGKAVLALDGERFAGFSYIETWGNKHYVTTSGLIVHPDYQALGVAKRIKRMTFALARVRWPNAKVFSLTSGDAVMKMNTALGYVPVSFRQLTDDDAFWAGCRGCVNHDILVAKERQFCICTGMLYDPEKHDDEPTLQEAFWHVREKLTQLGIECGKTSREVEWNKESGDCKWTGICQQRPVSWQEYEDMRVDYGEGARKSRLGGKYKKNTIPCSEYEENIFV